ncbi:MAG: DinB family protein [Defluviitaleaceae bacterium]|nr:DinB family protein [Defluviitaleaceae bacterium]MCL2261712.1 DinB family protein [Defluviitaleaceae bacterium]
MIESLKALLAGWKETRSITLVFLNELSETDLDKKLPRKKLNTIRLQVYELTLFQRDVVGSLGTNALAYEEEYKYVNMPTQSIIEKMAELDTKFEKALETLSGNEMMDYYGQQRNVHQIIAMMISHEEMHIGQIIAFCYATGIEIPQSVSEQMALEG